MAKHMNDLINEHDRKLEISWRKILIDAGWPDSIIVTAKHGRVCIQMSDDDKQTLILSNTTYIDKNNITFTQDRT